MGCCTPGSCVLHYLLEFVYIHVPLSLWCYISSVAPSPFAFNLSQHQGLFQWVNSSYQVAKELELQLQHQSFKWIFELISFRIYWFDLLAVHETLKSLLQHHSSKASILQRSAFFMVQLSHLYVTTGKTIALTIWTFVRKVMSLLLNTLSRFVIAFLPRSKHLLISWLSHSDFGTQENVSLSLFPLFPIYLPWSDGTNAMILIFWMLGCKSAFLLSSFIKRLFSSSSLSETRVVSSAYLGCWYFSQ